jgi:hypothetical protein
MARPHRARLVILSNVPAMQIAENYQSVNADSLVREGAVINAV